MTGTNNPTLPDTSTLCYFSLGTSVPQDSCCHCTAVSPRSIASCHSTHAKGLTLQKLCLVCIPENNALARLGSTPLGGTQAGPHAYQDLVDISVKQPRSPRASDMYPTGQDPCPRDSPQTVLRISVGCSWTPNPLS